MPREKYLFANFTRKRMFLFKVRRRQLSVGNWRISPRSRQGFGGSGASLVQSLLLAQMHSCFYFPSCNINYICPSYSGIELSKQHLQSNRNRTENFTLVYPTLHLQFPNSFDYTSAPVTFSFPSLGSLIPYSVSNSVRSLISFSKKETMNARAAKASETYHTSFKVSVYTLTTSR